MASITIRDSGEADNSVSIVVELIRLVRESFGSALLWQARKVDGCGDVGLARVSDADRAGLSMSTDELSEILSQMTQVFEGYLLAEALGFKIRIVDSGEFDVSSEDPVLVRRIADKFSSLGMAVTFS